MKISKKSVLLAMSGMFTMASLGLMYVFAENSIDLNVDPNNAIQHFKNIKIISTNINNETYAIINKIGNLIGIETDYNFVLTNEGKIKCDIDGDGDVDSNDTSEIENYIMTRSPTSQCNQNSCDINNDGMVTTEDLNICVNVVHGQDNFGGGTKLPNQILGGVTGSSILGGNGNMIEKGFFNEILGGKGNKIEGGKNNSILGGITNKKWNGNHSVIFGGKNNEITGSYSSIVGGEGNKITKSRAMAIGNNNTTNGYNSVAMGSGSTLSGQNSFLWTDGNSSEETLEQSNVFAIKGKNGVVVNTTKAHNLAQLTVSGSLIVYDNKKVLECTDDSKGVLKVIDGDIYNNNQKCFCSCDGSGRNALHEGTRCEALCNNEAGLQAECGTVEAICGTTPYSYTGADTSGACIVGELVEGTGAFLISTQSDNTEWIHRSCQTAYGQVTGCMQQLTGASCPNLRTGYECIWDHEELTGHLITNPNPPVDSATFWKYDPELKGPCSYICDQYGEWDPIQGECIFHECRGELPEGAKLNDEMALPMNDTTDYFYSDTSTGACSYKCNAEYGYYYSGTLNKCVTCPEGQAYDESDGTCKVACDMSNSSFGTITIMDESGYAITIADRNLGATSNSTQEVSSYGCYFQWGNNYGFQPQGNLETSTDFVDTSAYGPSNPYSSGIFRVRSGVINDENGLPIYGPNDDDWSNPVNDNLWGGAYDSGNNAFGVLDPDKENRRGPCPAGYHVPSIGERNDLLTLWYNKEYKSDGVEASQYIKDTGKITNFNFEGNFGLGSIESTKLVKAFRDYFKLPSAGNREFIEIIPGANYGKGGSFWTSSSPWLYNSFSAGSLATNNRINSYPNNANSFGYNIENQGGYVGASTDGRKMSAQSVRCFKDVPECPSGSIWNQSELRCETSKQCDVEHTVIQDLELFIISSTGEISHYTMMDRNLGAFEVYNQKGENEQNARSLGCHFQWGNNYGFTPGTQSTRYGIDPTNYSPSSYSNSKIYCKNRNGNTGNEQENDRDLNEQGNIFGSQYTPIDYHLRGGGYISFNRIFERGYGSDGTDIDRRGPCPEGYHVPRGIEMDDLVNNWNNASISQGAIGKNFASDLLMPYGRYIEVYCGEQNKFKVGGGIWLSDHIYKYYTGDKTGGHYMNHIAKFTDNSTISFSKNGLAHGFPVRCVKNNMAATPQKITIHPDGGTGAVIGIDWESEGSGKITALGTPTKNGINFLGWYSNPSFATEFKVNTGDYISSGGHLYARWDGCNIVDTAVQDLEVFFLLSPSRISHYVIMDRNLGATEAFNQDISSPNESSYGCYFQWGNNYPFNGGRIGSSATTGTLTDTENYGPNRSKGYYYNSTRYCVGGGGEGMYPYADRAGGIPLATWFWGGGWIKTDGDTYTNSGGINGTDIDRQGPCPTGYHIPRGKEMENIMDNRKVISNYNQSDSQNIKLEKSKIMASDLLLPFAGWNGEGCGNENHYLGKGMFGKYLISDYYKFEKNHLHIGETSDPDGIFLKGNGPAYGFSMRCVKNNISDTPQKVTINAYGGTGAVIAIDWETEGNGKIVTLGEPKRAGYDFGGWYSNPSFTIDVNVGDGISNGGDIYAKWIARDCDMETMEVKDLELFFLGSTGEISHYTIMDRNLGAFEVYNQKGNNLQNSRSNGCHFQWGNNYGFTLNPETTTTQVDPTNYGPSSYYSDKFYCHKSGVNSEKLYNPQNYHMWGGGYIRINGYSHGSNGSYEDRQGPCPAGYHIPGGEEMNNLINKRNDASISQGKNGDKFYSDLLIPYGRYLGVTCGNQNNLIKGGGIWLSDTIYANYGSGGFPANRLGYLSAETNVQLGMNGMTHGMPIRCVRNGMEDTPQKVTVHSYGGTGAVIAIDWETEESGKIMTLGEPTKSGYKFDGWYSDEGLTNRVNTGNYIPNNGHLYTKWLRNQEFEDLELYFLEDDGNIIHYTMMDRNMGATEIYNQDFNNPNTESFGNHYQWGNNWGFKPCIALGSQCGTFPGGESYTTNERVQKSEWSLNTKSKYVSNVYREINSSPFNWMADANAVANDESTDMWGGKGDTKTSNGVGTVSDRQGPCPDEYYVPSTLNWGNIIGSWKKSTSDTKDGIKMASDLLLPVAGARDYQSKYIQNQGSFGRYWSSSLRTDENSRAFSLRFASGDILSQQPLNISRGASVRCIKGVTNSQTINIHANGGIKAVIAIDCGKITALGEPIKTGYKFEGWYLDEGFTNKVNTGDYISSGVNLYAKWDELIAVFMEGSEFNNILSSLAGVKGNINRVKRIDSILSGVTTGLISDVNSPAPIIARYDSGSIYYYSEANKVYLNENSQGMFESFTNLEQIDVSGWNTSNVKTMSGMFRGCSVLLSLDVSNWDTSKVTNMSSMFENCYSLTNLDVSRWNTSNVSDISRMFVDCSSLEELDISNWNTSNVTNMFAVFGGNNNYMNLKHLDVSNWDTSKVTNMRSMFRNCINLTGLDVSNWDTSNVENMYMLFGGEYDYMNLEYLDVSRWDTSNVTTMKGTFRNCIKLTGLDVSNWDTSNVTDMRGMFTSIAKDGDTLPMKLEYLDVSNWDTSNVTDMGIMFQNCEELSGLDVSNWDTSNVTDMNHMFYGCNKLTKLDVSNWDTSNVTDMNSTFYKCNLTELDLTNRKTNKVTDMRTMFYSNTNLKTIYASTGFVTTNISSSASGVSLFHNDTKLVGGFGTKYSSSHINIDYAKIDSESQSGYFTQLKATYLLSGQQFNQTLKRLAGQNSATYNTSNTTITQIKQWTGNNIPSGVTTGLLSQNDSVYPTYAWFKNGIIYYYTKADRMYMNPDSSYMFNMLKNLKNVDMSEWKTNRVTNMEGIFGGCSSLTELNLINWNTSKVTNMKGMFSGCNSLTELDISNFYTRNVTDMSSMFDSCNTLTQLNLEGIHTENVTNMQRMFYGCHSLTELDVSNFDTSSVINMSMMFENDSNLTSLDVSNWDTSNVTDMSRVFVDCSSIEELDVSKWDTSKVTTMYGLFAGDDEGMSLKYLDVSKWDTSKVTNMVGVFRNCVNLISVDVSKWDTSKVTNMESMFYGNSGFVMNLEYVDVSKWDTSSVTDMSDMFQYCENLVGLDVSDWKTSNVTNMDYMFNYCKKLTNLDVSKWDTSKVTNMQSMFGECNNLTELDLSNWKTSNVTNMDYMFINNKRLKTIYASTGFVTTLVTKYTNMFKGDNNLEGGNGTTYNSSYVGKTYARIDQPGTPGYFTLKQ